MTVRLSFRDPTYKRIRSNFTRWWDVNKDTTTNTGTELVDAFEKELWQHHGSICIVRDVVIDDMLGMSDTKYLYFPNDEDYLMFMVKWG